MYGTYFRIIRWVTEEENEMKDNAKGGVQAVILDMSSKCHTLGYLVPTFIWIHSIKNASILWFRLDITNLNVYPRLSHLFK